MTQQKKDEGFVSSVLEWVPDAARRFVVPAVAAIGTVTALSLPAETVQEAVVYAGLIVTAITAFVEYQRSRSGGSDKGSSDGSGE